MSIVKKTTSKNLKSLGLGGKSNERKTSPNQQPRSGNSGGRKEDPNALISCDVNMQNLTGYMNNIIQVVNQHAKLLDSVSTELKIRPLKTEVGEMFSLLSHSYPFEKILMKMGENPSI